jgi:hypothetical protein
MEIFPGKLPGVSGYFDQRSNDAERWCNRADLPCNAGEITLLCVTMHYEAIFPLAPTSAVVAASASVRERVASVITAIKPVETGSQSGPENRWRHAPALPMTSGPAHRDGLECLQKQSLFLRHLGVAWALYDAGAAARRYRPRRGNVMDDVWRVCRGSSAAMHHFRYRLYSRRIVDHHRAFIVSPLRQLWPFHDTNSKQAFARTSLVSRSQSLSASV